jgi:hypothetical protein
MLLIRDFSYLKVLIKTRMRRFANLERKYRYLSGSQEGPYLFIGYKDGKCFQNQDDGN